MKRIRARFYRTVNGHEPVKDWLLDLDPSDRRTIGKDIATVEFGWPIGMPTCASVGKSLFEVRSTIRAGRVEARVYFSIEGDVMLLLNGHDGKKRQTRAIAEASSRLNDHLARERMAKRTDVKR